METYESGLKKEEFFRKMGELDIENVLLVDERGEGAEKPTGFVISGIWVSVFIGPKDSVWVGMKNAKKDPEGKERLIRALRLEYAETYPYVLESPSREVMEIWRKKGG